MPLAEGLLTIRKINRIITEVTVNFKKQNTQRERNHAQFTARKLKSIVALFCFWNLIS